MNLWNQTCKLVSITYLSLFKKTDDGKCYFSFINIFTFIALPILIGLASWYNDVDIKKELISEILTVLSIILAITLGVIFIIPEKLSKKIEENPSHNESDIYSKRRYKNFCKLFIQQLTLVLILSVFLILLTLIMKISPDSFQYIFSGLILGFFTLSILVILKIVVDIYIFLNTDISGMKI